jgi:hypothetical protein
VPLLQTKSASHCATATQLNQQAIVPLLQTKSASHCATATQINQQVIVPMIYKQNRQAIVPLPQN